MTKLTKPKEAAAGATVIAIAPPKMRVAKFLINGTAPLVIAAFSAKAQNAMKSKHEAGSTANSRRKREARNFSDDVRQALHIAEEGWPGFNATGLKLALVSACRTVGFKMTLAKLGLFVLPDGFEANGTPLLRIHSKDGFIEHIAPTRNATGVFDLRARPMWKEWSMTPRIRYDGDMFTVMDATNLIARAGIQVGIGEGRPDSKESCGCGWGTFAVQAVEEVEEEG